MNDLQKKILPLLETFIRICDQLELKYYLVCGSALGAVKYEGFIPWDDDIDVALSREDYEIFCKKAPDMLPEPLFLQNYHTDPEFPAIYSKLRDSSTMCVEESVASLHINHGICIDIFPLDGYPTKKMQQVLLELRKTVYARLLSIPCIRPEKWKEALIKPLRSSGLGCSTAKIAAAYTGCISAWPIEKSDIIANHGNWQGKLEYHAKDIYGAGSVGKFEGLTVRLPADPDAYLRQKYSDYKQELPASKRESHHRYLVVDTERSYSGYVNDLKENKTFENKHLGRKGK